MEAAHLEWPMEPGHEEGEEDRRPKRMSRPRTGKLPVPLAPSPTRATMAFSEETMSKMDTTISSGTGGSGTPEIRCRYKQMKQEVHAISAPEVVGDPDAPATASCQHEAEDSREDDARAPRTRPMWTLSSQVGLSGQGLSSRTMPLSGGEQKSGGAPAGSGQGAPDRRQHKEVCGGHLATRSAQAKANADDEQDRDLPSSARARNDNVDELDTSFAALTRRQAEWDRELDSVDQQQAELLMMQWKMVREQTGTLARELAMVQKQLKDLRSDSRVVMQSMEQGFREIEAKRAEEVVARQQMVEGIEQKVVRKLQEDLKAEMRSRKSDIEGMRSELEALSEDICLRLKEQSSHEERWCTIQNDIVELAGELQGVKLSLGDETSERKASEEATADSLHDLCEALQREIRERTAASEDVLNTTRAAVEQEKSDRNKAQSTLRGLLTSLRQELMPQKEEVPALRTFVQEMETNLKTHFREHAKGIDRQLAEWSTTKDRIERRVLDLGASLDKESSSRAVLAEEIDQIQKSCKFQLKKVIDEHAEAARAGRLELKDLTQELIDKEQHAREILQEALQSQLFKQGGALDAMQVSLRDLEQKQREGCSLEAQEWEISHLKLAEELARQGRELREFCQGRIADERMEREGQALSMEERLESSDRLLQDLREVFVSRAPRQKTLLTSRKAAAVAGSPMPSSSAAGKLASPLLEKLYVQQLSAGPAAATGGA